MGEVAKRLGSHLLMHQAKVKQHQQRDINTKNRERDLCFYFLLQAQTCTAAVITSGTFNVLMELLM